MFTTNGGEEHEEAKAFRLPRLISFVSFVV